MKVVVLMAIARPVTLPRKRSRVQGDDSICGEFAGQTPHSSSQQVIKCLYDVES